MSEESTDQTEENVAETDEELLDESSEEPAEKALPTKWKCPECKQRTTLYVRPLEAPSCQNPEAHKGKIFVMVPA